MNGAGGSSSSKSDNLLLTHNYHEELCPWFAPLVFWVPVFLRYRIIISDEALSFGYLTWFCRKTIPMPDIDKTSVVSGSSTWFENLKAFGGWGIRWGGHGWVYNPINGPWVEVTTTSGRRYRFSTRNAEQVVELLRAPHRP